MQLDGIGNKALAFFVNIAPTKPYFMNNTSLFHTDTLSYTPL